MELTVGPMVIELAEITLPNLAPLKLKDIRIKPPERTLWVEVLSIRDGMKKEIKLDKMGG